MDHELIHIGKITRAVGLDGELEINTSNSILNLLPGEPLFIEINRSKVPYFISEVRKTGDRYRIKFDDINTINDAQSFVSLNVFSTSKSIETTDNEISVIIGYTAVDSVAGELGKITAIQEYPGQDLLAINYRNKEVLVPMTPSFISKIDHKACKVFIHCPDGLLDVYQ
jgi:16S rRNA processing protein RimM